MVNYKRVAITDFLTPDEIKRASHLFQTCAPGEFARRCDAEIITPVLERINKSLGQENYSRFIAYAVEYALLEASHD